MLIDDYRARIDDDDTLVRGDLAGSGLAGETQRVTALAQRFVLSPLTTQTCIDLADPGAIARSRDYIFAPAVTTWLEWRGDTPGFSPESSRHGLLVDGRGDPRIGVILQRHKVVRAEDEPGDWQGGPLPTGRLIDEMKDED